MWSKSQFGSPALASVPTLTWPRDLAIEAMYSHDDAGGKPFGGTARR